MPAAHRTCTLSPLPNDFAIRKLAADARVPDWATQGNFSSITRTPDELSIIVEVNFIPRDLQQSRETWRVLKVHGPFDLSSIGVLASLVGPLAEASISVFTISTFDTDYLLIPSAAFQHALDALRQAGHVINAPETVPKVHSIS
jgi:hypothetical protein